MEIVRSDEFIKQTKRINDKMLRERIFKQIRKIIENPTVGDLLGHEKGIRKLYIPPFRLLYAYKDNKIYLLDLDHRDKIYKKLR